MPTIREINSALADRLYEEAQQNPQSPYARKKVGIANGKVVVVADDWDEVGEKLDQAEPDATKTFVIDMAEDYTKTEYIWGVTLWPAPIGR